MFTSKRTLDEYLLLASEVPTMFISELSLPDFGGYDLSSLRTGRGFQDSSKGGAAETGCSDLYGVICWFTI